MRDYRVCWLWQRGTRWGSIGQAHAGETWFSTGQEEMRNTWEHPGGERGPRGACGELRVSLETQESPEVKVRSLNSTAEWRRRGRVVWESLDTKKQGLRRVGRTPRVLAEGLGICPMALSELLGHRRHSSMSTLPQSGLLKTGIWVFQVLPGLKGTVSCPRMHGCWWACYGLIPHTQNSCSHFVPCLPAISYCCCNMPASH